MSAVAVPLLALVLASAAPAVPAPVELERRLGAMGTELRLRVEADDRAAALAASEGAAAAVEAVEARLSTWRPDSELSALNAAPADRPVPLSAATLAELTAAAGCRRDTGGAFDPGVGTLVAAWGLRAGGRVPTDDELSRALAAAGLDRLELDPGSGMAVRRHPGLRVEEGGFGKGVGLAAAAAVLAADPAVRRALIDLGGQLALVGEGPWSAEVADPRNRQRALVALTLDGGSLATSGNSERGIRVDGRRYGHLLDPATGRPVDDFGSVTVWTPEPLRADCLSTALYVMGPEAALEWAAAHPEVEALVVETAEVVETAPRVRATPGLARRAAVTAAAVDAGVRIETFRAGTFRNEIGNPNRPRTRPDPKRRTAVAEPWEGRTAVRENPVPQPCGARSQEEYR